MAGIPRHAHPRVGADLWCTGPLLHHAQALHVFPDCKTFVYAARQPQPPAAGLPSPLLVSWS